MLIKGQSARAAIQVPVIHAHRSRAPWFRAMISRDQPASLRDHDAVARHPPPGRRGRQRSAGESAFRSFMAPYGKPESAGRRLNWLRNWSPPLARRTAESLPAALSVSAISPPFNRMAARPHLTWHRQRQTGLPLSLSASGSPALLRRPFSSISHCIGWPGQARPCQTYV